MDPASTFTMFIDEVRLLLDTKVAHIVMVILAAMIAQSVIRASTDHIVERVVRGHRYASKIEEHKREQTLKQVFTTASAIVLWVLSIIVILVMLKVDFSGVLASAGLIGVVAGLSFQSLIKDFLGGIIIILENQFRVDDVVTLVTPFAAATGTVEDITIRRTRLRDVNGNVHIVNNGGIAIMTNHTFQFSNVDVDLTISYETDVALVEKLINEAGAATAADERFKENTIEPIHFMRVEALNEANVTVKALGKVRPGSQFDIGGDFRRRLKHLFVENHIVIPAIDVKDMQDAKNAKDAKAKK